MLIERSMHPEWLSNAYLVADEPGGTAVFVDSGAPLGPLHDVVEREGLTVTHVLTTHSHHDHVAGDEELVERYGAEIVQGPLETGGLIVRCVPGEAFCRYSRGGAGTISAMPLTQDLTVTAWGFGTGVSLYANVRARASLGDEPDFWPRADDHFDALAAYVEVDRERFRARAGRQWATTGLGFYNFDGVSLATHQWPSAVLPSTAA